jgi:PAS domain S-box-containing protein
VTIDSDSAKFSQALHTAIVWPVGVLLTATLLLLVVIFELLDEVKWSNHSYDVLIETRTCENLLVAGQNDVRGYLLTGDEAYAQASDAKQKQAVAELNHIRELVSDNPSQVHNVDHIIQAKDIWFEHSKIMIAHRTPESPANADWVRMGSAILGDIRAQFDQFNKAENDLRVARLDRVRRIKVVLAYASAALTVLLVTTIIYQVRRQMSELAASYRTALATIEQRHAALVRSENDLEAQKEWLRVTLTSIGDGVIVTDPEGRVVLMNHESERLTGRTQSEALHQPLASIFKIINEETRATVADPVAKVLAEKKVVGLANHTILVSRFAEEWPIEDSAAPITNAGGAILGVVLVFHDATDQRLAQHSLKAHSADLEKIVADRTVALQQTISELEAFAYTVSHDLRSPLRAMQGFSEAVLEDYGEKLDGQARDYLGRIKAAGQRLDRLIQDLLSYTRISREETPLETLDLDKIVRDVIEQDNHLKPPEATVRVEGPLPKVLGRESALNQVVTNLLGNAIKFVRDGEKPDIRLRSEERSGRVRLWVEDKGIGISQQDQERIFEMFVQVSDPARYGGTGVGLAIVRKAMQTMHGTVGVESTEGSGARFWVELARA